MLKEIKEYWQTHGGEYTLRRGLDKTVQRLFGVEDRAWRRQQPPEAELDRQRKHEPAGGLISVVIPVFNTDPRMLRGLLNSLKAQTYSRWEAVLYDGASDREDTLRILKEAGDERFIVIHGKENRGIAGNTNAGIAAARGAYIALCDHDDLLSPEALWRVAEEIERSAPDMIYSDEDRITENGNRHMDPHWKPDYCPVSLLTANYICHLSVIRAEVLRKIGGLRDGFDGSQDHDLFLRVTEITERIAHVPCTLYSWRDVGSSMSHRNLWQCLENGCRAVEEHEEHMGYRVTAVPVNKEIRLWYEIPRNVTIDVLLFGEGEDACEEGWYELNARTQFPGLSVKRIPSGTEHLAERLNEAAADSSADYLLMMDADIWGMNRHFLRELLMYAQRKEVAAVTPVLMDRRRRITHGGFALGMEGGAQCVNEGLFVMAGGWHDTMNRTHNVGAVSLCCALIRRDIWEPLDPLYRGGLGMVDWCMRQRERGKWCVFTPHAVAVLEQRPLLLNGTGRDPGDLERFRSRWGDRPADPCYSSRFGRNRADYRR